MKTALMIIALAATSSMAYATTSSDVVKYALTAHGIKYLLRDKRGSINAWKGNENTSNIPASGSSVPARRWGNTDCSGLASAAIRYGGYHAPEKRGKPAMSTKGIASNASSRRSGLSVIATGSKMAKNARHGDLLNRTGQTYGHVFIYNGQDGRNLVNTVEARCTKCGVGAFVKSWNDIVSSGYKLIRSKNVSDNIGNQRTVISRGQAHAKNLNKEIDIDNISIITIKSGDSLETLAMDYNTDKDTLIALNPEINFSRLKIGDSVKVN